MEKKLLVGISSCLLGEEVRYDGGHKLDRYLKDILGNYVEFLPICPEVECGMSIPREAVRLVDVDGRIRLMTQKSQLDMTDQMTTWMHAKLSALDHYKLCGFIFKSKSPSSGLHRIKIYKNKGSSPTGRGIFAQGFTDKYPLLPVEDEGRLHDPQLRDNFIERLFVMHRWYALEASGKTIKHLVDFHSTEKYALMSHSSQTVKELGHFLAQAKHQNIDDVFKVYFEKFIQAMGKLATRKKHTNVLQHIMGYFKKNLTADEKQELNGLISDYHEGLVPLVVPITLLNHYVQKYQPEYLLRQTYLKPHPKELMLRNHV